MFGPIVSSTGPLDAKIFILAESPGSEESARGVPLVGPSGHELRRMLNTVGVNLDDCRKSNVFSRQPRDNSLALYGVPREDPAAETGLGPLTSNPLTFLHRDHLPELVRVREEIAAVNPNLVLALGNTATWALGLGQGIAQLRGSVHTVNVPGLDRPLKVLPTYHPAAILRQWDLRVVALADLEKAKLEAESPAFTFDNSELWVNPTLEDLEEFDRLHMAPASICACDIETKRGQITAISFAPRPDISLSIPFWVDGPQPNYWPTPQEEFRARSYPRRWIERADLIKVFQNGNFDLSYIPTEFACIPRNCTEDSMLAHHSLFSELQKGLGFLGSVYTNSPSWKQMRTFKKEEQLKRDD